MKKKDFTVDGITYTVHATTEDGIKKGIKMVKAAVKRLKKEDEE